MITSVGELDDVMLLEPAFRFATLAVGTDVRALSLISQIHFVLDSRLAVASTAFGFSVTETLSSC